MISHQRNQVKTTVIHRYTPIRMAELERMPVPRVGKDVEEPGGTNSPHTAGRNEKWYNYSGNQFVSFL